MAKKFSLLLLYNKISASSAVVHALNAKGLDVIAVDNNKDLINFINKRPTDLVGLSVNHSNEPAIAQVLKGSTHIPFFNFAEDTLPATLEKLKMGQGDVKISGVVSSYTIWMNISSFVKEKTDPHTDAGKVVVFGAKNGSESLGHVNMTESNVTTKEGEIIFVETPITTSSGGVITLVEDEEVRLGKIGTPESQKLSDHVLQILSSRQGHALTRTEKSFPRVKTLKVVPVYNEGEKGLFVFSGDQVVTNDHVHALKVTICKDIHIDSFSCGDLFEFNIPVGDIVRWSLDNSLFSFIYNDQGRRMISYIKRNNLFPDFIITEDGEMCGVNIDALPRVPSADFDLFIYFNRNERKMPYIKKGDSINQEKLQSRPGLKVLYCRIEDRPKLMRIFIESSLNKLFNQPIT